MALETATYIDGLVATNPAASDAISTADDHLRLIKSTLKATFPNINGPMTLAQSNIAPLASPTFTGTPAAPTAAAGTNTTQISTTAFVKDAVDTSAALKADKATTITAGTGLTGGGDLSANRTVAIASGGVGTTQLADAAVTAAKLASGVAASNLGYTPVNPSAFTGSNQSLATSGYQKLPGGLIVQWGVGNSVSVPSNGSASVSSNFPISFPTSCLVVVPAGYESDFNNSAVASLHLVSFNGTSFTVRFVNPNNGTNGNTMRPIYIAIGY